MTAHLDIVVVGAGLSGICAAHHVATKLPGKSFAILEAGAAIGGTWDLFRYPGVRSDSDMFTLGYPFRPWLGENAIADGASILAYIRDTAEAAGLDRKVRFDHKVVAASWSSAETCWTLEIKHAGAISRLTCGFLLVCAGYYDFDDGFMPDFSGSDRFRGQIIHPQAWPADAELEDKHIVVIGSGATAVTLVPALAARGATVTMLQRSPSYIVALPAKDRFAQRVRRLLPARAAYRLTRWRNILLSMGLYIYARRKPQETRRRILAQIRRRLGPDYDVETHFNPRYNPWDQRMCLVPDADLFKALKRGAAEIVTDEIDTFTEEGLRLRSGRKIAADIVVAATGLKLKLLGGLALTVDGRRVDLAEATSYKGSMFSDVPNLAYALGYTNASWTLKCDLTSAWVCRLLSYMDRHGYAACVAGANADVQRLPLIDFTSGYIRRSIATFPKQGDRKPWRLHQNYLIDTITLRYGAIDDGTLVFLKSGRRASADRDRQANGSSASAASVAR